MSAPRETVRLLKQLRSQVDIALRDDREIAAIRQLERVRRAMWIMTLVAASISLIWLGSVLMLWLAKS